MRGFHITLSKKDKKTAGTRGQGPIRPIGPRGQRVTSFCPLGPIGRIGPCPLVPAVLLSFLERYFQINTATQLGNWAIPLPGLRPWVLQATGSHFRSRINYSLSELFPLAKESFGNKADHFNRRDHHLIDAEGF